MHRTDVGTIILADLIGARSCIYIKDEDGLYTDNPEKNSDAQFTSEITASELLAQDFDDVIVERPCLEILQNSEVLNSIQIINGLKKGNVSRALNGEPVGTIIRKG